MKASMLVENLLEEAFDSKGLKDFALNTPRNHKLMKKGDGTYACACGRWSYSAVDVSAPRARAEYAKHVKHYGKYDECHGTGTISTIRDIRYRIVDALISGPAPSGWLLQEDIYKFSCTQIQAPADIGGFLMQWGKQNIPEENLYYDEKGDNGREVEPHVTVKYGLQIPAPNQALLQIIGTMKPFKVKLGLVSLFENPKFDVVKVDVDSPELHRLNRAISDAIPCKDTFPDYHPHMTIAYVKKGTARALNGKNVFVDAPDVGSAFWAGNILFTGSGDGDDPDRVKQIIDFDHSKGPGDDLDESEFDPKGYVAGLPEQRYAVTFTSVSGQKSYFQDEKYAWYKTPSLIDATPYTWEDGQRVLKDFMGQKASQQTDYSLSLLPFNESEFDPKEFATDVPLPLYKVAFLNGPKYWDATWEGRWTPDIEQATGYSLEEAEAVAERFAAENVSSAHLFKAVNYYEVTRAARQDASDLPESQGRVCVKVHSVNDRCSYYFDGDGKMGKQPVPLDPHQARHAKRAAEKVFGKGNARIEGMNESRNDPFEGLGFNAEVSAFARRGRMLRKQRTTF